LASRECADSGQLFLLRLCRRKVLLPSYGRQSTSTPKVSSKDLSELSIHAEPRFMIAIQLASSHLKSFVDANKVIVTPIDVNQDIVKVAKSIRLEMEPSTTKKLASTGDDAEREEKWTEAVIRERLSEWTSSILSYFRTSRALRANLRSRPPCTF
jgi:hypothetical protein